MKTEFRRNGVRDYIYAIDNVDMGTKSPEEFIAAGPFALMWYQRSLVDEPPRNEQHEEVIRLEIVQERQNRIIDGFLFGQAALDAMGSDTGTSRESERCSNYVEGRRITHRKHEVGDQCGIAGVLNMETMITGEYRRAGPLVPDTRLEFTVQPETHRITIPGAGMTKIGVINDGLSCFRGKDVHGHRSRRDEHRVSALEVKKELIVAFGQCPVGS